MQLEVKENPLVSIIVITYNSAKYVLDTLESAKAQTYQNIELIISDDFSTDNTVDICRNWLNDNSYRFVRTELIPSDKNTGIAPNCNRGTKASTGVWLKLIAGDDILLNDCIETLINASQNELKGINAFFGLGLPFEGNVIDKKFLDFKIYENHNLLNISTLQAQKKLLTSLEIGVNGPGVFLNKRILDNIGGFDERLPMLEDHPLFIKFINNDYKIGYLERIVILKRINEQSVTGTNNEKIYRIFMESWLKFVRLYIYDDAPFILKMNFLWKLFFYKLTISFGNKGKFLLILRIISNKLQPRLKRVSNLTEFSIKYPGIIDSIRNN